MPLRNQGIASRILSELEEWAVATGATRFVLETGLRHPDAIALYTRNGYSRIPNFGQYAGVANSVCFEKRHQ